MNTNIVCLNGPASGPRPLSAGCRDLSITKTTEFRQGQRYFGFRHTSTSNAQLLPFCLLSRYIQSFKMVEGAPAFGAVAHLLPQTYKRYISEWLEEDTPSFDYGGFVVGEEISEAKLLGKSEVCTLAFSAPDLTVARGLWQECRSLTRSSGSWIAREFL